MTVSSHAYLDLPDVCDFEGIPFHRFRFREALQSRDASLVSRIIEGLRDLKRQASFEVLHLNSLGPLDFFHHVTKVTEDVPYIVTMQQQFPLDLMRADSLPWRTLSESRWVACCSGALQAETLHIAPQLNGKTSVVYSGLNVPEVEPGPLPWDPCRLLCLGRLLHFKGFDIALKAFQLILGTCPSASLTIAGDGGERQRLEALSENLGISDRVLFTGWVQPEQVPHLLNQSSIVMIPSRWEGLPLVGQEAALMARPIVAANAGGLPELVSNHETGIVVEREDHTGLAQAVISLMENPGLAATYGRRARERTTDMFSLSRCVSAYEALYRECRTQSGS